MWAKGRIDSRHFPFNKPTDMIDSLPIVLVQRGAGTVVKGFTNSYVNYTVAQARLSNPDAHIVVIGDEACRASLLGFESEFIAFERYDEAWAELKAHYVHLSVNPEPFESFAMARWLILQAWMIENDQKRMLTLDTDVMLYATLEEMSEANGSAIMWHSNGSGHCTLLSRRGMDELCDGIRRGVTDPAERKRLLQWSVEKKDNISDMTFIAELSRRLSPELVLDGLTCDPRMDHNINLCLPAEGDFVMEMGIKKVHFEGLHAFCTRADGSAQRFATLHFQGPAKKHMCDHLAFDCANPIHRGIVMSLQSNHKALKAAATAEDRMRNQAIRLGEIRNLVETMRQEMRHLELSTWVRLGAAIKMTNVETSVSNCEEIRQKICGLAPRIEQAG